MNAPSPIHVERPFNWGVLLVADLETSDIPGHSPTGFSTSPTALAIAVRHAHDVEIDAGHPEDEPVPPFCVRVSMERGRLAQPVDFACQITVPSGRLSIGDAEAEAVLEIAPGTYHVEVAVTPRAHPEEVQVRWTLV